MFMLETMIGAYLKGMKFVFEIQNESWEKINQLYDKAPVSTEQILHPGKWTNNEHPFKYEWSSFDKELFFQEWTVIDTNTIGEIQWRIIFSEHGMALEGKEASAGWDGDIYAILKKKNNDDLLLLLFTSWDSDNDAQEFSENYQKLLKIKYKDGENPAQVVLFGKDVLIVEGGDENSANSLLAFMKKTKKIK